MALRGVQVRVRIRVRVWDSRGELFSEGSDFQIKFGAIGSDRGHVDERVTPSPSCFVSQRVSESRAVV